MKDKSIAAISNFIDHVKTLHPKDEKLQSLFEHSFLNTIETTMDSLEDGTTFVLTGDIPAMWLRDSAAQVRPYLLIAEKDENVADLLEGVILKQVYFINHDPYANAFNNEPNNKGHQDDDTEMTPLVWERKYEIDSLCYPIQLAYLFWKSTGRISHFNHQFEEVVQKILDTWEIEQNHQSSSLYRFQRDNCPPTDTLPFEGKGAPVGYTGMTWSGFRPSDDACQYGYLIPSNMFAVVALRYISEIATDVLKNEELAKRAEELKKTIKIGIETFGKVEHPDFGTIYAYETDGLGNYNLMDDANVPSLLSIPYLGYCDQEDPTYINTRNFILSKNNPYYFEGKLAKGIGSPHTPTNFIWHIALAIQGLTSTSHKEKDIILNTFKTTDANTNLMHEGFHVDDPKQYTRPWFSWANSMFCEFLLSLNGRYVKGSPLYMKDMKE